MVSELNDASLSQYIVLVLGKKFSSCMMGPRTSTMALEGSGCITANFENLSTQVKNNFLSVDYMSICSISPAYEGIGVTPNSCFLGCLSYFALVHVLQLMTTSLASLVIFGKYKS